MITDLSRAQDLHAETTARISKLDAFLTETHAQMRTLMSTMSGLDHDLLSLYLQSRNRHVHVAQRMGAYAQFVLAHVVLTVIPRSVYRIRPKRSSADTALIHAFRVKAGLGAMRARYAWRARFWRIPRPTPASPH